jgi:hypothetical protein
MGFRSFGERSFRAPRSVDGRLVFHQQVEPISHSLVGRGVSAQVAPIYKVSTA